MKNNISTQYVDEILHQYFPKATDKVTQAMEYSLFGGGKRFRPMLLLATAKAVGKRINEGAKALAAALEFVHTYSLIHDDLPCMDNDDLRRGKRSCHMQFGEAAATLAGDGLLNLAAETAFSGPLSNKNYQKACAKLFAFSGVHGMIYGQSLDLFSEMHDIEDANDVALHKTGDLLRAAIVCGALCGGAKEQEIEIFDQIASKFGICYQIVDDLLDSEKCEKSFLDVKSERALREYASKLAEEVDQLCSTLPYDLSFIQLLVSKNLSRKY